MKTGKLDSKLLEEIVFGRITHRRPEVLVRPGIGEDCAVVDFGPYECVLSTDPITAAVGKIGKLAVAISCNDIASNGVEPLGLLLACLLPEGTTVEEISEIMRQAGEEASRLGVEIIGGHTEITAAVRQPVIVSTAIGRANAGRRSRSISAGDRILMTKAAGLEGSGILATDLEGRLSEFLNEAEMEEARSMLDQISVVTEGIIAGRLGAIAMHDITEGGVLGAVWELCRAGGVGARIIKEAVPVFPVTEKICEELGLDWLRLISSGSLLIVAAPEEEASIVAALIENRIAVSEIGEITGQGDPIIMVENEEETEIAPPDRDELYKVVFAESD